MRFLAWQLVKLTQEPFYYIWENRDIYDYVEFMSYGKYQNYCDWFMTK